MSSIVFFTSDSKKRKGVRIPCHTHSCYELVYYYNCAGISQVNGKAICFGSNSFALLPPNTPHEEQHNKSGTLSYIGFETASLPLPVGIYRDDEAKSVMHTVNAILWEKKNNYVDSEQRLELLFRELMLLLQRMGHPTKGSGGDLAYAKTFIEENFSWKISFPELAKSFGFSFDAFRKKFKETYGMSPKSYLVDLRLKKARELLQSTDLSCTQIAYECGFSDSAQFSTMYRNRFGIPPKQSAKPRASCESSQK